MLLHNYTSTSTLKLTITMSQWCLQALERVLEQVQVLSDGRMLCRDALESCIITLELVVREFVIQSTVDVLGDNAQVAFQHVQDALILLSGARQRMGFIEDGRSRVQPPTSHSASASICDQ